MQGADPRGADLTGASLISINLMYVVVTKEQLGKTHQLESVIGLNVIQETKPSQDDAMSPDEI